MRVSLFLCFYNKPLVEVTSSLICDFRSEIFFFAKDPNTHLPSSFIDNHLSKGGIFGYVG